MSLPGFESSLSLTPRAQFIASLENPSVNSLTSDNPKDALLLALYKVWKLRVGMECHLSGSYTQRKFASQGVPLASESDLQAWNFLFTEEVAQGTRELRRIGGQPVQLLFLRMSSEHLKLFTNVQALGVVSPTLSTLELSFIRL